MLAWSHSQYVSTVPGLVYEPGVNENPLSVTALMNSFLLSLFKCYSHWYNNQVFGYVDG